MLLVTPAGRDDVPAIVELLEELDRFYGATDFDSTARRAAQVEALLFRDQPAAHVMLARDGDEVIGLAAYSFLWPAAGVTHSLYLKELYVANGHRRRGVGRILMEKLQQVAAAAGCSRLEWTADDGNAGARRFYEELGFSPDPGKLFYRQKLT